MRSVPVIARLLHYSAQRLRVRCEKALPRGKGRVKRKKAELAAGQVKEEIAVVFDVVFDLEVRFVAPPVRHVPDGRDEQRRRFVGPLSGPLDCWSGPLSSGISDVDDALETRAVAARRGSDAFEPQSFDHGRVPDDNTRVSEVSTSRGGHNGQKKHQGLGLHRQVLGKMLSLP